METEMVNALAKYLAPGHGLKQTKFLVVLTQQISEFRYVN